MASLEYDFSQQKVVLTGGIGGIGFAVLNQLVKAGASVVISARDESLAKAKTAHLPNVFVKEVDLKGRNGAKNFIADANEILGGIDVLICNAGCTKDKLSVSLTDADWDEVISVNLTSAFVLNREAAKIMLKKQYGRVINLSSVTAITGNIGQANYAAAKAGIIGFTKTMALEYARKNITFNVVAPGFIDTPMTQKLPQKVKDEVMKKIPMDRYGSPEEVVAAIMFLASHPASYITGSTLHVNGGMLMV